MRLGAGILAGVVLAASLALAACTSGLVAGGGAGREASSEATLGPAPDRVLLGVGPVTVAGTAVLASFPAMGGEASVVATVDGLFGLAADDQLVALSPDGLRVAYLKAPGGRPPRAVVVADLVSGKRTTVYRGGLPDSMLWAGERLLVETAFASRTVSILEADAEGRTTDTTYTLPAGAKPFPQGVIDLLGGDEEAAYFGLFAGADLHSPARLASVWRGDRGTGEITLLRDLDADVSAMSSGGPTCLARPAVPPDRAAPGLLPVMLRPPMIPHRGPSPHMTHAPGAGPATPTVVVYRLADMSVEVTYAVPTPSPMTVGGPVIPIGVGVQTLALSPDGRHYLESRGTEERRQALVEIDGPSSRVTTLPLPAEVGGPMSASYADSRGDVVFKTWTQGSNTFHVYFYERSSGSVSLLATQTAGADNDFLEVVGAYRSR